MASIDQTMACTNNMWHRIFNNVEKLTTKEEEMLKKETTEDYCLIYHECTRLLYLIDTTQYKVGKQA